MRTGVNYDVHFEKEKSSLRELIELCDVALALIHERRQLLKLLRQMPSVRKATTFQCHFQTPEEPGAGLAPIQLAFRNPVGVEDDRGGVEAVRKESAGLSSFTVRRSTPTTCLSDHARVRFADCRDRFVSR